jgi:antitoxin CptB
MSETALPKHLRWRMRRGMKELDLVLTRWAEANYPTASEHQREAFDALLLREDPDIWSWLMGYADAPEGATCELIDALRAYR